MSQEYRPIQVVQSWIVTNASGPITIYPQYAGSNITVMEVAPDASNKISHWFESWWERRPCKNCTKVFTEHDKYTRRCGDCKDNPNLSWKTTYTPMDNLTYVEQVAKERNLL